MQTLIKFLFVAVVALLSACSSSTQHQSACSASTQYQSASSASTQHQSACTSLTRLQQDSIAFFEKHHYAQNYNFVVLSDSIAVYVHQPDELPFDTLTIRKDETIVVASFMHMPHDSIDSVWIKVAHDHRRQGWLRESVLLANTCPDNPLSWFISLWQPIILPWGIVISVVVLLLCLIARRRYPHLNIAYLHDIPSPYPSLLILLSAVAAVILSSACMFTPDAWRHFYFHPTLSPLTPPLLVGLFIALLWLIVIVVITTVDQALRHLSPIRATVYIASLAAACLTIFCLFRLDTELLVDYIANIPLCVPVIRRGRQRTHLYRCGRCHHTIAHKGTCPHCGAINE